MKIKIYKILVKGSECLKSIFKLNLVNILEVYNNIQIETIINKKMQGLLLIKENSTV